MKVTSKVNKTNLRTLNFAMCNSLVKATDATKTDIIDSQIMPFDTGEMQNKNTFLDDSKKARGIVLIKVDTPYARRLYFHPEFNFKTHKNPNAQGMWFSPYISGNKKMFLSISFTRFLKKELSKYGSIK